LEDEAEILDVDISLQKNKSSIFSIIKKEDGNAIVSFDYMNPQDYVYLKIVHTGKNDDSINITGVIIGETKLFSTSDNKSSMDIWLKKFLLNIGINPKYHKSRGIIGTLICIGILLSCYNFKDKIHWIWLLLLIIFSIRGIYIGIQRIFFPSPLDSDEFKLKVDLLADQMGGDEAQDIKSILSKQD